MIHDHCYDLRPTDGDRPFSDQLFYRLAVHGEQLANSRSPRCGPVCMDMDSRALLWRRNRAEVRAVMRLWDAGTKVL